MLLSVIMFLLTTIIIELPLFVCLFKYGFVCFNFSHTGKMIVTKICG